MNTWDLTTITGVICMGLILYYGIKTGRTIEELYAVGGTVAEALITEPANKLARKCGGIIRRTAHA